MAEEKFETSFACETALGDIIKQLGDRGAITPEERKNLVHLVVDYGFLRYREGFDEGLSK